MIMYDSFDLGEAPVISRSKLDFISRGTRNTTSPTSFDWLFGRAANDPDSEDSEEDAEEDAEVDEIRERARMIADIIGREAFFQLILETASTVN